MSFSEQTSVVAAIPADLVASVAPMHTRLCGLIVELRPVFDLTSVYFVSVVRRGERITLVLDAGWVQLLRRADVLDPELLTGLAIPGSALLAILPDWPTVVARLDPDDYEWTVRLDGVVVVRPTVDAPSILGGSGIDSDGDNDGFFA